MKESERKWEKKKENEIKWKNMKENERNERKWKKMMMKMGHEVCQDFRWNWVYLGVV